MSEPYNVSETSDTLPVSNYDLIRQQQQAIKEQDEGLETLSSVIARQKEMGLAIHGEVTDQNALIDDIDDLTAHTTNRIRKETHGLDIIRRKSSTCGLYVIIVVLLLVIIVIASVPAIYQ
ncbi:Syntaxin-8 [Trichoplax sp. H2]|uniref:t-SNARE coiled-coil homology domain-containing protein n=1 Tax=Trichoplax adhaerens TaxID=10228 RepID=B3RN55_TRIAD|nr:hypothetical protein TRIADDRAFT_53044 [Trichoplax adhaerens]EDV27960.1 hypothetical protein TRIADDRAFT_53044 [Trichoplax adhaerens]RDD43863.1 Syntaxin-8 [Trichoplax sp. H2]|eukprot:XP_002109794.1 hypothetical protein TRIADDRAFT_53044 [Trichoplax adhaerens]